MVFTKRKKNLREELLSSTSFHHKSSDDFLGDGYITEKKGYIRRRNSRLSRSASSFTSLRTLRTVRNSLVSSFSRNKFENPLYKRTPRKAHQPRRNKSRLNPEREESSSDVESVIDDFDFYSSDSETESDDSENHDANSGLSIGRLSLTRPSSMKKKRNSFFPLSLTLKTKKKKKPTAVNILNQLENDCFNLYNKEGNRCQLSFKYDYLSLKVFDDLDITADITSRTDVYFYEELISWTNNSSLFSLTFLDKKSENMRKEITLYVSDKKTSNALSPYEINRVLKLKIAKLVAEKQNITEEKALQQLYKKPSDVQQDMKKINRTLQDHKIQDFKQKLLI
eukprot:snap_masked-scaffold_7-processed-gene-16.17-mRNA-1 protein AED:1.00 eAED:1.00 QI:0/-1/0/0/-1/1/1/0/337